MKIKKYVNKLTKKYYIKKFRQITIKIHIRVKKTKI